MLYPVLVSYHLWSNGSQNAYKIMTPIPTAPLLMLHMASLPYLKVVQLRSSSSIFFSAAPSLIPCEFHIATAMKAANHSTAVLSALHHPYSCCMLTCVEHVDRKESVCICELLCSTPHWYHDEVDDCRYAKEALRKYVSLAVLMAFPTAHCLPSRCSEVYSLVLTNAK